MNLPLEETRRLAELMTGEKWRINDEKVTDDGSIYRVAYNGIFCEWKPALDGQDWQKLQALDVIVAVFDLPYLNSIHKVLQRDGKYRYACDLAGPAGGAYEYHDDLLEAAARALLSTDRGEV